MRQRQTSRCTRCEGAIVWLIVCSGSANLTWGEQLFSAYLDRSYYTTEPTAVIVCDSDGSTSVAAGKQIVAKDAAGRTLAGPSEFRDGARLVVPLGELPVGELAVTVSVLEPDGRPLESRELNLVKRTPQPGCEWKVDHVHRVILRNGTPFFPHGLIAAGSDADYQAAAEIGFNTMHTWMRGRDAGQAAEYVKSAAEHGVFTIVNVDGFCRGVELDTLREWVGPEELEQAQKVSVYAGRSPKKLTYGVSHAQEAGLRNLPEEAQFQLVDEYYEKNAATFNEAISLAKRSPNLIGYCLYDEPGSHLCLRLGEKFYRAVREMDGYHPSFVVYSSIVPIGDEYVDWVDCLGTDPYWTPGESGSRGNVNYVSKITYLTKQRADQRRQVTWSVPMGEYWSGIRKRAIMPKEQFAQTYLAVIHGAKAITYFRWPFLTQQTRETHAALCQQMERIGPIAVTPDIPQVVNYDPGTFDPDNDQFPDVQVSLRHNPAGGYVLLAANSRYYQVDVTYRISLLQDGGQVQRLLDSTKYDIRNGVFSDHVEFLGTRAYAFDSDVVLNGPIEISVRMRPHPDRIDPVYGAPGLPDTGRPEKRNLFRNPGFEEAGLPGWPDYYLFTATGPLSGRPGSEPGYGLDTEHPYEGNASLWIRVKDEGVFRFGRAILHANQVEADGHHDSPASHRYRHAAILRFASGRRTTAKDVIVIPTPP